jgi:hypothetical protein
MLTSVGLMIRHLGGHARTQSPAQHGDELSAQNTKAKALDRYTTCVKTASYPASSDHFVCERQKRHSPLCAISEPNERLEEHANNQRRREEQGKPHDGRRRDSWAAAMVAGSKPEANNTDTSGDRNSTLATRLSSMAPRSYPPL